MIKAILFDLDNTLMDFMRVKHMSIEAAVDAMIDVGLAVPKEEMIKKIFQVYEKEGIEDQQIFNKVLQLEFGEIDYKVLAAGVLGYRRAKEGSMVLYPHVHLALMGLLKMGVRMAILTDAPRLPAWMRVVGLGLQHYFDHVFTFDDTRERKPSPAPFKRALQVLQLDASEVLMIGDWAERDVVGAKKVGIRTVFARYGDRFGTVESGANYDINDILELVDIVRKENKS